MLVIGSALVCSLIITLRLYFTHSEGIKKSGSNDAKFIFKSLVYVNVFLVIVLLSSCIINL